MKKKLLFTPILCAMTFTSNAFAANNVIINDSSTITGVNGNIVTNEAVIINADADCVEIGVGNSYLKAGNLTQILSAPAYIQPETGSVMLPLRNVGTVFSIINNGAAINISWDSNTKTATVKYNGKTVSFTPGNNKMTVDGVSSTMANNAFAEIRSNSIFIPLRAVSNALDARIVWNGATKTVMLYK